MHIKVLFGTSIDSTLFLYQILVHFWSIFGRGSADQFGRTFGQIGRTGSVRPNHVFG